jgi:hypothetical protein
MSSTDIGSLNSVEAGPAEKELRRASLKKELFEQPSLLFQPWFEGAVDHLFGRKQGLPFEAPRELYGRQYVFFAI